jgi:hypothetical protein
VRKLKLIRIGEEVLMKFLSKSSHELIEPGAMKQTKKKLFQLKIKETYKLPKPH